METKKGHIFTMLKNKESKMGIYEIIKFETELAKEYDTGKIKFPVHLSGCKHRKQEKFLVELFKNIKKTDYIISTWRNHYHWLLSERNPEELLKQVRKHGSMHVYDKNFITSSIVGGIAPIALGLAFALKRKKSKRHVWCFIGCMAHRCGIVYESIQYAKGHDLPITYVVEDNDISVQTATRDVWGMGKKNKVLSYKYIRKYPHQGTGKWVLF